jgi:hypothetical protein
MLDAVPQIPECQVLREEVGTEFIALAFYTEPVPEAARSRA